MNNIDYNKYCTGEFTVMDYELYQALHGWCVYMPRRDYNIWFETLVEAVSYIDIRLREITK